MTPPPASRTGTVACVTVWLALQAVLPLRHWLIPGDVRATFEGLSFSWRLKAEVYRSEPCGIFVEDPGIVRNDQAGCARIDWPAWHGDPVVYSSAPTEPEEWRQLPEVVVLLGPMTGERIVYNPFSGRESPRSEAESRRRVAEIWASTYSRQPRSVRRTLATIALLDSFATAFRTAGQALPDLGAVLRKLAETRQRDGFVPQLTPLRWIHPCGLARGAASRALFSSWRTMRCS